MKPETAVAGHRPSEGRERFNRIAGIFLMVCGLSSLAYVYSLNQAISAGEPVSLLESHEPNVLSYKGEHARVTPEVAGRIATYGRITTLLFVISIVIKASMIVVNSRLPASVPPDRADELGPVRITASGVAHAGGVHWPVVLPRDQVERLELEYTPGAENPVIAVFLGAVFTILGLPLAVLILPRIETFEMFSVFCLGTLLGGTGIWMVWFGLKKRFVLIASTANGSSRMVFPHNASREKVIEFAIRAAKRHRYTFDFGEGLVG